MDNSNKSYDAQSKFLSPDSRWELWNVHSQKDFMNKCMLEGKFHSGVPQKITNEYQTIERLMYFSYFYYPLLDEVISKFTRLFEASVTMRLKDLGLISGDKFMSLSKKLNKLNEYTSVELMTTYNYARKFRNIMAHLEAGNLFGLSTLDSHYMWINLINFVFLEKEEIAGNTQRIQSIRESCMTFKDKLCVLQGGEKRILIEGVKPINSLKKRNQQLTFFQFIPVLINFPQTNDDLTIDRPIVVGLKSLRINKYSFSGVDIVTNEKVKLSLTSRIENLDKHCRFKQQVQSAPKDVVETYKVLSNQRAMIEVERLVYQFAWS